MRHKNTYEAGTGRVLGYILHQNLYSLLKDPLKADDFTGKKEKEKEKEMKNNCFITVWLLDVFRSPLSDVHREWFLARCQEKALLIPPEPTPPINSLLVYSSFIK